MLPMLGENGKMEHTDKEANRKYVGYTLRISSAVMDKLHYIADYNQRPISYELRPLIIKFIGEFEKKHGKITISPDFHEKLEAKRRKH